MNASGVVAALIPGSSHRWAHVVARNYASTRSAWFATVTGAFEPFLFLASIGIGVSVLVGDVDVDGRTYDYTTFVAPAMLASAAMNGAITEASFNTFGKLRWHRIYHSMTATPLTPTDIAVGEIVYAQLRGTLYSTIFLLAMVVLGLVESWWAVLALPAAVLIGVAFSAAGLAVVTVLRTWQDIDLIVFGQMLLFLFSATFYPLSVYPEPIQMVAQLSPLFHGANLCRDLVLGTVGWYNLINVAVLLGMTVVCSRLAARRFTSLLYK